MTTTVRGSGGVWPTLRQRFNCAFCRTPIVPKDSGKGSSKSLNLIEGEEDMVKMIKV